MGMFLFCLDGAYCQVQPLVVGKDLSSGFCCCVDWRMPVGVGTPGGGAMNAGIVWAVPQDRFMASAAWISWILRW